MEAMKSIYKNTEMCVRYMDSQISESVKKK
jgi:hypothetical protein